MATQAQPATASSAQAAQSGLVSAMLTPLGTAWLYLDVSQMARTLPDFTARIAALVHRFAPASATLAAMFYREQRRAAGITAPFTPRPADPPPLEQIGKTVSWATRDLWTIGTDTQPASEQQMVAAAQTQLAGAIDKLVLDTGRNTIIDNVTADPKAKAWARVPEPGCCYFCAMLAIRGAVYGSEQSADFKTHDHCRCQPEPVFNAYEPTAQIRQWQALWADSTAGVHGMKNMQKAWRAAFETAPSSESPPGAEPTEAPGGPTE